MHVVPGWPQRGMTLTYQDLLALRPKPTRRHAISSPQENPNFLPVPSAPENAKPLDAKFPHENHSVLEDPPEPSPWPGPKTARG